MLLRTPALQQHPPQLARPSLLQQQHQKQQQLARLQQPNSGRCAAGG
jgi:hypothetical protein